MRVPQAWDDVEAYLDDVPGQGKVIILPRLDYYQAPTTWGYYGTSFLHHFLERPVVEPLPGGYYSDPIVDQHVASLEQQILDGDRNARAVMQAIGAKYLVLRRDLQASFPGRSFVAPRRLARTLPRTPGLHRVRSFGPLDLYETDAGQSGEVYAGVPLFGAGAEPAALYRAIQVGPNVASVGPGSAGSLDGVAKGEVRLVHAAPGRGRATVTLTQRGIVVAFSRGRERTVLLFPRVSPPFRAIVGTRSFVVTRAHSSISLPRDALANAPTLFRFPPGEKPVSVPIPSGLPAQLGDCYRYDGRTPNEVGLTAEVVRRDGIPAARLGAREHAACVSLPIENSRPRAPLRIQLAYRSVSGNPARICLWQVELRRCAPLPRCSPPPAGTASTRP